jgi:Flp pilus assembly protein TadD
MSQDLGKAPGGSPLTLLVAAAALALVLSGCAGKGIPKSADTDLEFAGQMARIGNWREAIYRWERALSKGRNQAKIYNNLAVAHERLGHFDQAAEAYERALELGGDGVRQIQENYRQFLRFYKDYREREVLRDGDDES